jgi:hypothetical protein
MGPETYEVLQQPPPGYEPRKGSLAAEYVLALAVIRRANLSRRRWRSAALLGWLLVAGLAVALVAVW